MADRLTKIQLSDIEPAADNLRTELTDIQLLADSIAFIGLLEPIRVIKTDIGYYKVIAGHRRHAALLLNGETETQAIVQSGTLDDADRTAAMLIENMQRVDLDIRDQAEGIRRLVQDHGMSQADLSASLGVSKQWVQDRISILNVPEAAYGDADHPLSIKHLALLGSLDEDRRTRLMEKKNIRNGVPSAYDIEDAWNKQNSLAKAQALMTKLVKAGTLAIWERDFKKLLKLSISDSASLSGNDMVIKQLLGAAQTIGNSWGRVAEGETVVVLKPIHGVEKIGAEKNTIYVCTNVGGYQSWSEVEIRKGKAVGTQDETLTADDEVQLRNDAIREEHEDACRMAEARFLETAKPAEMVSYLLGRRVQDALKMYQGNQHIAKILLLLGQEVNQDEDPGTTNVDALAEYANKNAANLARAAAAVDIVRGFNKWSIIDYPADPQYEGWDDEDEDDEEVA